MPDLYKKTVEALPGQMWDALVSGMMSRYRTTPPPGAATSSTTIGPTPSHTSWLTDPATAIAEAMGSYSEEDSTPAYDLPAEGMDAPTLPSFSGGSVEPFKGGLDNTSIQDKFDELANEISLRPQPEGQTPPDEVDPWKVFAATLAGSFASQIAKRPDLLDVATRNIDEIRKRRQEILDQNYKNRMLFDENQYNRVMSVRVGALETLMKKAIDDNDAERAAHYAGQLNKIQENAQRERLKYEQESLNYRQEQALQAGKEEKKMEIDSKVLQKNAEANKPLEMKDYNAQTIQIESADPDKLVNMVDVKFLPDKKEKIDKGEILLYHDAAAAMGGTDEVKAVALTRLVSRLKMKLKINKDFSKFTDQDAEKFFLNMVKYGIPSDIAQKYMGSQGINFTQ